MTLEGRTGLGVLFDDADGRGYEPVYRVTGAITGVEVDGPTRSLIVRAGSGGGGGGSAGSAGGAGSGGAGGEHEWFEVIRRGPDGFATAWRGVARSGPGHTAGRHETAAAIHVAHGPDSRPVLRHALETRWLDAGGSVRGGFRTVVTHQYDPDTGRFHNPWPEGRLGGHRVALDRPWALPGDRVAAVAWGLGGEAAGDALELELVVSGLGHEAARVPVEVGPGQDGSDPRWLDLPGALAPGPYRVELHPRGGGGALGERPLGSASLVVLDPGVLQAPPAADAGLDLVDPAYPQPLPGDYRRTARVDLDGDGREEQIVVLAAVELVRDGGEFPGIDDFAWDDGQPWQVYVEEPGGQRTYLFSQFVQLGTVEALVDPDAARIWIVVQTGAGLDVYEVIYEGPGDYQVRRAVRASGSRWTAP